MQDQGAKRRWQGTKAWQRDCRAGPGCAKKEERRGKVQAEKLARWKGHSRTALRARHVGGRVVTNVRVFRQGKASKE